MLLNFKVGTIDNLVKLCYTDNVGQMRDDTGDDQMKTYKVTLQVANREPADHIDEFGNHYQDVIVQAETQRDAWGQAMMVNNGIVEAIHEVQ
jgi:hypothetical protein